MLRNESENVSNEPTQTRRDESVYNRSHTVDVVDKDNNNSKSVRKNTWIQIRERRQRAAMTVRVHDPDNFTFNYATELNRATFERMKNEQSLTIGYDELSPQIVELLETSGQMRLRLEIDDGGTRCRMVFYEQSRIKALIFLVIDLVATDDKELIAELIRNVGRLKESNETLRNALDASESTVDRKDRRIREADEASRDLERRFVEDTKRIERTLTAALRTCQATFERELVEFERRLGDSLRDIDRVKRCNELKNESSKRLVDTMQELRLDNERHADTIDALNKRLEKISGCKTQADEAFQDANCTLRTKERELDEAHVRLNELQNDVEKSTSVIRKLQTHNDELSKEVFQANQMLVNYNKHYDRLTETNDNMKEQLERRDARINELGTELTTLKERFERYCNEYNSAETLQLRHDVMSERSNVVAAEKKLRDATKLNELLTSKLAGIQTNSDLRYGGSNKNAPL